jgi:hypothetical protein
MLKRVSSPVNAYGDPIRSGAKAFAQDDPTRLAADQSDSVRQFKPCGDDMDDVARTHLDPQALRPFRSDGRPIEAQQPRMGNNDRGPVSIITASVNEGRTRREISIWLVRGWCAALAAHSIWINMDRSPLPRGGAGASRQGRRILDGSNPGHEPPIPQVRGSEVPRGDARDRKRAWAQV